MDLLQVSLLAFSALCIPGAQGFVPGGGLLGPISTGRGAALSGRVHSAGTGFTRGAPLYGRVTPRTDERVQEEGAEQEVPRLLGAEDAPEIPAVIREGTDTAGLGELASSKPLEEMSEAEWTERFERRLQDMYARGTYDPTPVNLSPEELARQQWIEEFMNKEDSPIEWNFQFWFGTWTRSDTRFPSPGRAIKSFGFAMICITLVTLLFLVEDEILNPIFEDYNRWDGNDFFHVGEDVGAWLASVPPRVQYYFTHFNWPEFLAKVSTRAGAAPRWYQQVIGPLADGPK